MIKEFIYFGALADCGIQPHHAEEVVGVAELHVDKVLT